MAAALTGPTPPTALVPQGFSPAHPIESPTAIWFQNAAPDPDALYARRADLTAAREAARLWRQRLEASRNTDFESAWKLARADYWLGGHLPEAERRSALEEGVAAGRAASTIQPSRSEGHFWAAANMGALAESFGLMAGLKYRGAIKQELETVLKIDPAFQQGSADRALGRWYFKVPRLFGGSKEQSVAHLRRSLTYDPTNHASFYFLAETLQSMGRTAEAREALETLIASPDHPGWAPEDQEFKAKARAMLDGLRSRDRAISRSRDVSGDREILGSIARSLDRSIDYLS